MSVSCASYVYLAFHLFIRPVSHAFVHFARSLFYLFVRPIFVRSIISLLSLCLFTRLLTLFVESLVPFFFFFSHSFPLSFSYPFVPFLFHSLCFSHPFAVSVLNSLVRFLLHPLVPSLFCSNFCSQYFTVSFILFFYYY